MRLRRFHIHFCIANCAGVYLDDMATTKNYYDVLGVDRKATKEDIKKAFRKLAQKHHPDKGGGDEAKFKEITEAYSVLSDDRRRREYDAYGQSFPGGPAGAGGAQGNPFAGFDFSQFQQGDFGDIFGDIFSGGDIFGGARGRSSSRQRRGRDISIDVQIDFKDSIFGTKRSVLIAKIAECDICKGSGAKPGTELEQCVVCGGKGQIHETRNSILGSFTSVRACTNCDGTGKVPKEKCVECKGHGVRRKEEEIHVVIPAGIENGEMIRLPQQGEAIKAGIAGDLYVKVHVRPHPTFFKDGTNLVMRLPVKLTDALRGATITINTLEGKTLEVKVPVMHKTDEILRVRGRGVPLENGRGDLLIHAHIALPTKLSNKAKKAVEDLASEGL